MLDDGKIWDALTFFQMHDLDVLLLAETGVTAGTHISLVPQFSSDFTLAPRPLPGYGVGVIFGPCFNSKWFRVDELSDFHAFRAWLASWGSTLFLLGVMYAPHAGYHVADRVAFFEKVGAEWRRLQLLYPRATCFLAGDMNIPGLVPALKKAGSAAMRGYTASAVDVVFSKWFLQNMTLLNNLCSVPTATHRRGNVLDLVLTNRADMIAHFQVLPDCVAGSDHFPVTATFEVPMVSLSSCLRWTNFKDINLEQLLSKLQPMLLSLHTWLEESLRIGGCSCLQLQLILQVGAFTLGVIILGSLYQIGAGFGRFRSSTPRASRPCLPRHLREAVDTMRAKRGAHGYKAARGKVRKLFMAHHRKQLRSCVRASSRRTGVCFTDRMFSWVQQELQPKIKCSELISIDGNIVDQSTAILVWAAFLESQTSWHGQHDPSDLFKVFNGELQFHELQGGSFCNVDFSFTKEWLKAAREHVGLNFAGQFSWAELCDACSSLNPDAAPPPSEPIPVKLLNFASLELRACYHVLINLCVITSSFPPCWATLVVTPLLKPGKSKCAIQSHRPVSLMPIGIKLVDRMLFARVWLHIQPHMVPWQGGGTSGADTSVAAVGDIVRMRALGALPGDLVITFVDGQSAFCRPPALAVVDRLRRLPIDDHNVVLTAAFLSSLWSKAALFGNLHGHWHNQTGLPQGGALSTALFNLVTLDAYEQLHDANLGISIGEFICPANAYVDDIVLFAPNEALAQSALGIVSLWAAGIRMQLNIGKEKTARLRCLGAATTALSISGQQLPEVSTYRYLGGLIHWKGSNKPLLDDLEIRLRQKTGQFLRWAHARQIPVSVLGQLWVINVQPIALWTLAATHLTLPDESRVDLIQRKLGRMILGHSKRSPKPSALLLLGWTPWSAILPVLRVGLLLRTMTKPPSLLSILYSEASRIAGTWCFQARSDLESLTGSSSIPPKSAHDQLLRKALESTRQAQNALLIDAAYAHACMSHFPVDEVSASLSNGMCPVAMFEHPSSPVDVVKLLTRLWTGGQGLRAGDRARNSAGNEHQCLFCSHHGRDYPDDLHHLLEECPFSLSMQAGVDTAILQCMRKPWDQACTASQRLRAMKLLSSIWRSRTIWLRKHRPQ